MAFIRVWAVAPADREEVLEVLPAPGLDAGASGALAQQVKIEGPLDWPRHAKSFFEATGLLACLPTMCDAVLIF